LASAQWWVSTLNTVMVFIGVGKITHAERDLPEAVF
jgi:hypothetical protein